MYQLIQTLILLDYYLLVYLFCNLQVSEASKATPKLSAKSKSIKNLYCSACNKLFKNVNSFENHENSKKHKENVINMTLDDEIAISDNNDDEVDVSPVKINQVEAEKVNGLTEEERDALENSTSDIEDNDIRETLSDDSDKVQVCIY